MIIPIILLPQVRARLLYAAEKRAQEIWPELSSQIFQARYFLRTISGRLEANLSLISDISLLSTSTLIEFAVSLAIINAVFFYVVGSILTLSHVHMANNQMSSLSFEIHLALPFRVC